MYKYEGLGCIYWHMVSKLLLAVSEVIVSASQSSADKKYIDQLDMIYEEIKDGLGVHKSPARYGAFPIDPYSHTPGFTGVQQPGMTGQVKEDVITRFSELGVKVSGGEVTFAPVMLKRDEFLPKSEAWFFSTGDVERSEKLEAESLAFTLCAVPLIYRIARTSTITVFTPNGKEEVIAGSHLGQEWSRSLFERNRRIQKIVVDISQDVLR